MHALFLALFCLYTYIVSLDARLAVTCETTCFASTFTYIKTRDRTISIRGQMVAKKFCAAVKIVAEQSTTGCHDVDSGAEFFWPRCGVLSKFLTSNTTASRGPSAETPRRHPASRGHSIVTPRQMTGGRCPRGTSNALSLNAGRCDIHCRVGPCPWLVSCLPHCRVGHA